MQALVTVTALFVQSVQQVAATVAATTVPRIPFTVGAGCTAATIAATAVMCIHYVLIFT